MITQQELLELVTYKDGVLFWSKGKQGRRSRVVGNYDGNYWRACINYERYQLHHLIWLYHQGFMPVYQLDHIDGDTSNNRIENLRDEKQKVNVRNSKMASNNTSGYNRVSWREGRGKWLASYKKQDGKVVTKHFEDKHEAGAWQKEESIRHGFTDRHGEKIF